MISTTLYWIAGPWPGKLAMAARPRGGDWLSDELLSWRGEHVDTVFSLLTPEEEADLDITDEARLAKALGMRFLSFPIADRQVPGSETLFVAALESLDGELRAGRNVALHCRQGIGRTGLVAACLLATKGIAPEVAVRQLSHARGIPVPETEEQRIWIDRFASAFVSAHHE
jgi:protein-tyrosine phosphatase